ncbi:MAG: mismatch repair protein [Bryobacterales bacterium]|nr:mismatch repair protein [Bryobacterales bacterium]
MRTGDSPAAEYARRLEARRGASARLERRHVLLGNVRLILFAAGAALAWLAFVENAIAMWLPAAPAALFAVLAIYHESVIRKQRSARRAEHVYENGIARLEDRWEGLGEAGERFRDPAHPYSEDLDLFGKGGLFDLLSAARTVVGENTLAKWLLAPSPVTEIRERHGAVEDLRPRLDFREDLAVLAEDLRTGGGGGSLVNWAEEPGAIAIRGARVTAVLLSCVVLAAAIAWAVSGHRAPFSVALTFVAGFGLWLRARVLHVLHSAEQAAGGLSMLASVLKRIEPERFTAPSLAALRNALDTGGLPPSKQIARLNRLVELIDSRDNVALRIIGPPLLYGTHLAFAVEAWRARAGVHVRQWLDAVGEIEALSSLAAYSYEHPDDAFPEFADGPALFDGENLGHPLLPAARTVRNSVQLHEGLKLLLVSGSNMSGKSTLLRTVGINTALAMAGAPVRAARLRLSPLAVGASIRITDSLQGGASRFYAEITRLRRILDIARGPVPLLFLLDELLNGTNSHDRRIGAEGIVRGFLEHGALGLVTTHDLALTEIATSMGKAAANVHFEDHLEEGVITFDYKLHDGVVQKSNALEMMRAIGLHV